MTDSRTARVLIGSAAGFSGAIAAITGFSAATLLVQRGAILPVLWVLEMASLGVFWSGLCVARRERVMAEFSIAALLVLVLANFYLYPASYYGRVRAKTVAAALDIHLLTGNSLLRDQLPIDPFSPQRLSLKVRRDGTLWKIWSVGPDETDDGGRMQLPLNELEHVSETTVLLRVPMLKRLYWTTAWRGDLVWTVRLTNGRVTVIYP